MAKFEVAVIVTSRDYVTVEADHQMAAERMVTDPDFDADQAVLWAHDTDPEIALAPAGARRLED